jgi:hypothetical protein
MTGLSQAAMGCFDLLVLLEEAKGFAHHIAWIGVLTRGDSRRDLFFELGG